MRMLFTIPVNPYSALVEKCVPKSKEYALLKNGIIHHPDSGDEVHFLCTDKQAEALFEFVIRVAPEHLSAIKQVHMPLDT